MSYNKLFNEKPFVMRHFEKHTPFFLLIVVFCIVPCIVRAEGKSAIMPFRLTCEYMENPSVVDRPNPRLSWINRLVDREKRGEKQTAWQIRVSSSKDLLLQDISDLWDSGKIKSEQSNLIIYKGEALQSMQECWWQVRVWDAKGNVSAWSRPAYWCMGLLHPSDWKAKWIGAPWQGEEARYQLPDPTPLPAPLMRKDFSINKKIASAKAFVTGLGYFELYLNGKKVGEDVLSPNQTNYGKRPDLDKTGIPIDDKFRAYRVLYMCYDLTDLLRSGKNTVGCILGNGFYNPVVNWTRGYGSPRFLGQIEITYVDGTKETIVSDESWLVHRSAIVGDGLYYGEVYDARLEIPDWSTPACNTKNWQNAVLRKAPEGILSAQTALPDRVMERLKPVSIELLEDGTYEVDFGEEISGWLRLDNIQGDAGETIEIKYLCESPNGVNKYTLKGSGEESYAARFTWFVFRKVQIKNWKGALTSDNLTAEAVYSNVETTGKFECSNALFNQINKIWQRSQTDNMHGGVASDCPHRERSAYTGDGQVACNTVMYNFDAAAFYTKWIQDIWDAQNTETGYVPNGAPWQPGCGGGVPWGAAMNIMPWEFYLHYGDRDMLERNYTAMKEQVRYMQMWLTPEGTMFAKMPFGRESVYWMNLGEWCPPYKFPSDELVHTYYMWRCADIMSKTAKVLGNFEDETIYMELAAKVKDAFHKKFYDAEKATYGEFGSNVFALNMGVPDDCKAAVVNTLKREIEDNDGHLNTGIFATQLLFEVLTDNGLNNLAYGAMNKRDFPSFGHWIAQGATTTWEQWDGGNSRNHPMFGGGLTWFYRKVAGMNIDSEQPGYKHIIIKPVATDSLSFASYSTRTPYGEASVRWEKENGRFKLNTVIPVGSTATVYLPAQNASVLTESGKAIRKARKVKYKGIREGFAVFEVSSGVYAFEAN